MEIQANRCIPAHEAKRSHDTGNDAFENHPYSFSGLSEIYEMFMMNMAGEAEIPPTRLFGRSPDGMNATGESDLKNDYEKIGQLLENVLRPALNKLLPVICVSMFGCEPEGLVCFEPLTIQDPMERGNILSSIYASRIKHEAGKTEQTTSRAPPDLIFQRHRFLRQHRRLIRLSNRVQSGYRYAAILFYAEMICRPIAWH